MSKWGKEKKLEEFLKQFDQDYTRFHIKPDNLDATFTRADESWYDRNVPNKIVRNKAKMFHLGENWRDLEKVIQNNKAYGIAKAKRGSKINISLLAAYADSRASGMVAVCDKIGGFPYRGTKSDEIPHGEKCDLYINGFSVGNVDKIDATTIRPSKSPVGEGTIRDSASVGTRTQLVGGKLVERSVSMSFFKGKVTVQRSADFGKREFNVRGRTTMEIPIITRDLDAVDDEDLDNDNLSHEFIKDELRYKKTFPCQTRDSNDKLTGFQCVNWVKFMTRDDANASNKLGKPGEIILL